MAQYCDLFCRNEEFEHVSRYVTRLLFSINSALGKIYDGQMWQAGTKPSRRAMPAIIFAAG
jgi:hypothetical protein